MRGQHHVLVEATPDGWWYSAPLPSGGLLTLLTTDADLCRDQSMTEPRMWLAALGGASATAARVMGAQLGEGLRVHPATSLRSLRRTDHRPWLAVGDAGLAVDPVTGSGVTRALRSAASAASTVCALLDSDPSTYAAELAGYEQARDAEFGEYLQARRAYYAAVDGLGGRFWSRRRVAKTGTLVS